MTFDIHRCADMEIRLMFLRRLNTVRCSPAFMYRQTSEIRRDKIVDHSDVVGASPVGAVPTWLQWIWQRQLQGETRNF